MVENSEREKNPLISWDDFQKVDIRVGTIKSVQDFPEARIPAFKLFIDFGPLGIKKSSAQITRLYSKRDLIDRQVLAVVNFPKKQIANFRSEVLVLGLVSENNEVILISPDRPVPNGIKLS
ncbi:MAG: tRNA-binding protein [Candidatus Heimdallarchaeota archaeon]